MVPPYAPPQAMAPRRSQARWLAPVALVACAVAVYAVARSGTGDRSDNRPAATADKGRDAVTTSATTSTAAAPRERPRRYTIKPGDTLSGIAVQTGVSLDTIVRLNPGLDSQTLQTGQTIKLAP